jgi:acetyltransferase-like isoleucine patch superfamily enzyme
MMATAAHRGMGVVVSVRRRFVRRRILMSLWVRAIWVRARVDCDIAADVKWGRRLRITVEPRTHSAIRVAPLCNIGDDVQIVLHGGTLVLGEGVDVRARCVFEVGGRLEFGGCNVVSYGSTFHCDEVIKVGYMTGVSEYCTLADVSHTFDGPNAWFVDNIETAPVEVGESVWLGAKVTVAKGVHIGSRSMIGANSVVVKDVPPGHLASGVPARVVRPVEDRRIAAVPASSAAGSTT